MQVESRALEKCIALLDQAGTLVATIDDDVYARKHPISPHGAIGTHLRHILDFYTSFLTGIASGRIDYNVRARDPLVEQNRIVALRAIENAIAGLRLLATYEGGYSLLVCTEEVDETRTAWCRSTLLRELEVMHSHTIHHYSLIAMLLRLQGVEPGPEFGVAPSTLNYWHEEAACVR